MANGWITKYNRLDNGKSKNVQVEVRKKRTFVKRSAEELAAIAQAEENAKRAREAADEEIRIKEERLKSLVFSNEKEINEIKELEDKIEVLEKNQIKIKKQYEHLQLVNASLAQDLGLSKGFIESLQLESNAAIEDERSKMKAFVGTHEVSIR